MLTGLEQIFYNRHLLLDKVGEKGQLALKKSKVLVIGAGGLGCPVLSYLTGAGCGHIGIVDGDQVSATNLHRQLLFGHRHIGQPKTTAAIEQLRDINPFIQFSDYMSNLTASNALDIIKDYDIVVDATDNFPVRYLINDACVTLDKPWVFASVDRFQGQLSVLNYMGGPTYRCLFPKPPQPETAPSCSEVGVLGVLPGILGSLQANEVIKMIVGYGQTLSGKIMMVDSMCNVFYSVAVEKNDQSHKDVLDLRSGLTDEAYSHFCQVTTDASMEISVEQVKQKLAQNDPLQFVDIRNVSKNEIIENAVQVPLPQIDSIKHFDKHTPIIIVCEKGEDSLKAVKKLKNGGLQNVFSLRGGWQAWKDSYIYMRENG